MSNSSSVPWDGAVEAEIGRLAEPPCSVTRPSMYHGSWRIPTATGSQDHRMTLSLLTALPLEMSVKLTYSSVREHVMSHTPWNHPRMGTLTGYENIKSITLEDQPSTSSKN